MTDQRPRPESARETERVEAEFTEGGQTGGGGPPSFVPFSWPAVGLTNDASREEGEPGRPEALPRGAAEEGVGLDGRLAPLLVVGGAVLVLVPEPVTSLLGALLVVAGVAAWLADRSN